MYQYLPVMAVRILVDFVILQIAICAYLYGKHREKLMITVVFSFLGISHIYLSQGLSGVDQNTGYKL